MSRLNQLTVCLAMLLLASGVASAADKKLMHCFAFTAIESATAADWEAFYKATDALPGKIPGLSAVWYGKLSRPLGQFYPDAKATGGITRVVRQYGVCMEFKDQSALKAYADNPAHAEWVSAYDKVRVPHTTTFDILPVK
jgi:hypothetical protein